MKLLIVDDEYHVIKTVRYLLQISPIQFDEIFEAQSAKDAITIIERERPEILITDVLMADVTGLDLMNYLNSTSIPIKTIVISGYNNFEYIRAALKEGGVDYLLKPIDADQLFSAVETAINQWEKEDAQKRQTLKHLDMIQSMSSLCKETLLYRIMTQSSIEKYYQDLLQIVPGLKQCRNCMVGYANCGPFFSTHSEKSYNVLKEFIASLDGILQKNNIGSCFWSSDDTSEILLFLHHHTSDALQILQDSLEKLCSEYALPFSFGISRPMAFPSMALNACKQARTAFFHQTVFNKSPVLLLYNQVRESSCQLEQPDLEQKLFSALITGNEELLDASISEWIHILFEDDDLCLQTAFHAIEHFNHLMENWNSELSRQYPKLTLSDCPKLFYFQFLDSDGHLSLESLKKSIKFEMFQLSGELTSPSTNPQNDVIYQVAHYIRLNYAKPFSQFSCAQLFFINKNYMCRKFKNTFHTSMVSYLNQIRIDHAKELLETPGVKIKDVANLVGFEDEKYFSRQFHKNTGLSPNEYRAQFISKAETD